MDRAGKTYTGALCGLGWSPASGTPVLPEHDMELAFDVRLSVEDVVEVGPPWALAAGGAGSCSGAGVPGGCEAQANGVRHPVWGRRTAGLSRPD